MELDRLVAWLHSRVTMVKDAMIQPDVAGEPWQEAAVFMRSWVATTAGSPERFHPGFLLWVAGTAAENLG